jgi:hypothetical protein
MTNDCRANPELLKNLDIIISYTLHRRLEVGTTGLRADLLRRGLPLSFGRALDLFDRGVITLDEVRNCLLRGISQQRQN